MLCRPSPLSRQFTRAPSTAIMRAPSTAIMHGPSTASIHTPYISCVQDASGGSSARFYAKSQYKGYHAPLPRTQLETRVRDLVFAKSRYEGYSAPLPVREVRVPDFVIAKSQREGYHAPLPVSQEGELMRTLQVKSISCCDMASADFADLARIHQPLICLAHL